MSDELSDEERALIDAALAQGKVKTIPCGVSGEPQARRRMTVGRRRDLKVISKIRSLAASKMNDKQIGDAIGKSRKAVSNYRYRYNIRSGYVRRMVK